MPLKSLEHLASEVDFETLPANWNTFDLARFSPDKTLWDYQQQSLRLALAVYASPEKWVQYQHNGMAENFSWSRSAAQYAELYRSLIAD